MSATRFFLVSVLLIGIEVTVSGAIQAQYHTAQNDSMVAKGWTFVRSFDSVSNINIAAYGDTVVYSLYDGPHGRQTGSYFSLDGGLTVDHRWVDPGYPSSDYQGQLFKNDPVHITLPSSYENWHDTIYLSTNLGRIHEKIFVDTAQFHFPQTIKYGRAWLDPTDDGTVYIEFGRRNNNPDFFDDNYSYLVRSTDTGKTWIHLELPGPDLQRHFLMDVRQHGLWYVVQQGSSAVWYRTTDNGMNFEFLNGLSPLLGGGEEAGVGYPGELRRSWGPDRDFSRGFISWKVTDNSYQIHAWADSLVPGRPDTMRTYNGNLFTLNYTYSAIDPSSILVQIDEEHRNLVRTLSFEDWWFYSPTGFGPFVKLWDDSTYVTIIIDHRDPSKLWVAVPQGRQGDTGTYNIYKREMPRPSSAVKIKSDATGNNTFASLSAEQLALWNLPLSAEAVKIYDILGRQIFASSIPNHENGIAKLSLPSLVVRGNYFVMLISSKGERIASTPVAVR